MKKKRKRSIIDWNYYKKRESEKRRRKYLNNKYLNPIDFQAVYL